jgi:ferredoxin
MTGAQRRRPSRPEPLRPAGSRPEPDREGPRPDQSRQGRDERLVLRVDPVACEAHGLCIELLPELIAADPWGYPILRPGPVPDRLVPLARRAVRACPTLALKLTRRD